MQGPRDAPDWLDPASVRWCAERCEAIAARLVRQGGRGLVGAQVCGSHLRAVADCFPLPPLRRDRSLVCGADAGV